MNCLIELTRSHDHQAAKDIHSFLSTSRRHPLNHRLGNWGLDNWKSLRVVFWNIHREGSDPEHRASSVIKGLKEASVGWSSPVIVILHGVHQQAFEVLCKHSWVNENFALSTEKAPRRSFTLILVSRQLQIEKWFRVTSLSRMERDALVVDIPISSLKKPNT
jgi:hypothetical protein